MVHTSSLIATVTPEVRWKMVTQINDLSHVLHLVSKPLRSWPMIDEVKSTTRWSETTNTTCQVLILWSGTVTLDGIQVELSLVGCARNASFIDLRRNDSALISLFLVHWSAHLVTHLNLRSATNLAIGISTLSLICLPQLCLLGWRLAASLGHIHLLAIAPSLRPSFDLILYILCLFLV